MEKVNKLEIKMEKVQDKSRSFQNEMISSVRNVLYANRYHASLGEYFLRARKAFCPALSTLHNLFLQSIAFMRDDP